MITLTINGRRRELEGPTNLIDFLQDIGVNRQFVAVAHNGEVLEKESFPRIMLNEGDELEIVQRVGGG